MHEPSGPPKFDQRDWAAFDFSRWHLDGLALDATSAAFADLSQRLFSSEEWRQHFQGSLPTLQHGVLTFYREQSRQLEDEKTAVARDFDERIAAAKTRSQEFGKTIEIAGSPPVVQQPDPQSFHVGVRVTAGDVHVGLPGIVVQMTAPRDPKTVLTQGVTDRDGNALLTVPVATAGELDKGDATLEVLTPSGKSLQKLPDAVCIRPNQAETKVVSLKDSADIAPHKSAALSLRSEREARARDLVTSIDRLKQERQARLHDLDRRLEENRKIIAEFERAPTPAPSAPTTAPEARPDAEPAKNRPSASRSGRKRR